MNGNFLYQRVEYLAHYYRKKKSSKTLTCLFQISIRHSTQKTLVVPIRNPEVLKILNQTLNLKTRIKCFYLYRIHEFYGSKKKQKGIQESLAVLMRSSKLSIQIQVLINDLIFCKFFYQVFIRVLGFWVWGFDVLKKKKIVVKKSIFLM